jgi:hypothetical protein
VAELSTPELVENRRRSIAMLPSGVPALFPRDRLQLPHDARKLASSYRTPPTSRGTPVIDLVRHGLAARQAQLALEVRGALASRDRRI